MRGPDYFRGCCTFEAFLTAFVDQARRHSVPLILISRLEARRSWRDGWTGAEAFAFQHLRLLREADYLAVKHGLPRMRPSGWNCRCVIKPIIPKNEKGGG